MGIHSNSVMLRAGRAQREGGARALVRKCSKHNSKDLPRTVWVSSWLLSKNESLVLFGPGDSHLRGVAVGSSSPAQ